MFHSVLRRAIIPYKTYNCIAAHSVNPQILSLKSKHQESKSTPNFNEQIEYISLVIENNNHDWVSVKNNILSIPGNVNQKNYDSIMLKNMINMKNFEAALSFAQYLKGTNEELSLGSINGLLNLYSRIGIQRKLQNDEKQFIIDIHKKLYIKYKVLDFTTAEKLVHALCVIDEWETAIKVLADIHFSTIPSHSAYSTVIATLFRLNKKKKALQMIEESLSFKRPLSKNVFEEWINYILRKYKDKKVVAKHLDEICVHLAQHCIVTDNDTAARMKDVYNSLEWNAQFSRIRKTDGQCSCCQDTLDLLKLSNEEFDLLQKVIKDKLIVGSDLFLKTSPDELKRFSDFIDNTMPYDVVLDGLNISYAISTGSSYDRLTLLDHVVEHFVTKNKKVLVLGRRHMLNWSKSPMQRIKSKAKTFFTEDLSQDDPYFITAAILCGSNTDIVSKDLLRGHKFLMKDERLKNLFTRWQWQHQWMVVLRGIKGVTIQPPLQFTPFAQKKNNGWHLPYQREVPEARPQFNDGTPDLSCWLCLRPKQ